MKLLRPAVFAAKDPAEIVMLGFDFADALGAGVTITSQSVGGRVGARGSGCGACGAALRPGQRSGDARRAVRGRRCGAGDLPSQGADRRERRLPLRAAGLLPVRAA